MPIDAVDLEVIKASLSGIVQEMQNSLFRTGFSTIVRESQDASCGLMNAQGELVAQHVVLPLHIGAFPACCAAVLRTYGDAIAAGDAFLINHPYEGGSPHAPDMAVITPVFIGGALFGFCGSIAHKGDIGGPVPGSCSGQARETFNEGLHLPAVRYQRRFVQNTDIERITPEGVVTVDGELHRFDVLIYGTGFQPSRFLMPMKVVGRGGVDLHHRWDGDARAYLGITVPGFPNFFILYGPNTNIVVNGSIIWFTECEVRYVLDSIKTVLATGARARALDRTRT